MCQNTRDYHPREYDPGIKIDRTLQTHGKLDKRKTIKVGLEKEFSSPLLLCHVVLSWLLDTALAIIASHMLYLLDDILYCSLMIGYISVIAGYRTRVTILQWKSSTVLKGTRWSRSVQEYILLYYRDYVKSVIMATWFTELMHHR